MTNSQAINYHNVASIYTPSGGHHGSIDNFVDLKKVYYEAQCTIHFCFHSCWNSFLLTMVGWLMEIHRVVDSWSCGHVYSLTIAGTDNFIKSEFFLLFNFSELNISKELENSNTLYSSQIFIYTRINSISIALD